VSAKGQITLPAEVRKRLGIRPKDRVDVQMDDEAVTIRRGGGLEQIWSGLPARARVRTGLQWKEIEEIAHDEHAENAAREGLG